MVAGEKIIINAPFHRKEANPPRSNGWGQRGAFCFCNPASSSATVWWIFTHSDKMPDQMGVQVPSGCKRPAEYSSGTFIKGTVCSSTIIMNRNQEKRSPKITSSYWSTRTFWSSSLSGRANQSRGARFSQPASSIRVVGGKVTDQWGYFWRPQWNRNCERNWKGLNGHHRGRRMCTWPDPDRPGSFIQKLSRAKKQMDQREAGGPKLQMNAFFWGKVQRIWKWTSAKKNLQPCAFRQQLTEIDLIWTWFSFLSACPA